MTRKEVIILKNISIDTLCRVSVLIALEVVLERFLSFQTPLFRIGLGFVPLALCGIMYGPYWAAAAGCIADILGSFIAGLGFYPPITITAILTGLCFGLFLHRKKVNFFPNVVLCTLVNTVGLSLFLQSYWLSLINPNKPTYLAVVSTRLIQCLSLILMYLILIPLLQKLAFKLSHLK